MEWYAIQVITGKEAQVIAALKDFGTEVMQPQTPMFLKRGSKISLQYKSLLPGYVIAKLEVTDFYKYQRDLRVEKMMIRLCGNGYDSVLLNNKEYLFLHSCCQGMKPMMLKKRLVYLGKGSLYIDTCCYDIVNSPPWAENAYVEWYDKRQFEAKLHIKSNGALKDHAFKVAAWCSSDYSGTYEEQLKGLLLKDFGRSNVSQQQAITV